MPGILDMTKKDICILTGLVLFFSLIYLPFLYYVPFQVNTDEITIMMSEKALTDGGLSFSSFFGLLHDYFYFPALSFTVFGWLGRMFGGVNLENMRLVHALSGLIIVGLSYLFFRVLFQRRLPPRTASPPRPNILRRHRIGDLRVFRPNRHPRMVFFLEHR